MGNNLKAKYAKIRQEQTDLENYLKVLQEQAKMGAKNLDAKIKAFALAAEKKNIEAQLIREDMVIESAEAHKREVVQRRAEAILAKAQALEKNNASVKHTQTPFAGLAQK